MSIYPDPGHGFVVEYGDERNVTGADMGPEIYLSTTGMYGRMTLTPSEARALAAALHGWADEKEGT